MATLPVGLQLNALPDSTHSTEATLAPVRRHAITALGWLEPSSSIVKLVAPATVEASRLARLDVKEGDFVRAGQIVGVLDTAEKLKAQLETSEAQVALKEVLVERVRVETRASLVSRRMAVVRAKADLEQAEAEFSRQQTLVGRDFATPANLEKKKRDLDVARAQLEEAQSALHRLEAGVAVEPGRTEQIDIAIAQRELAAAEADRAQTKVMLDQASIRSPIQGRVLVVHSRPGEKISSDGLMEVGSTQTMVAIAEVYQTDIGNIRIGQPVEIKSDVFSQPVKGEVERIGLKVKRQSVINNDPATDTDSRVVEVRVALDANAPAIVSGLTNLQVRAYFKLVAP